MKTPRWQQWAARVVLVTFSTSFVGCGGAGQETPPTTSTVAATPTTLPPPPPPTAPLEPPTTMPAPPPPTPTPTFPAEPPEKLSQQDLRELVAPVALYPDVVLASLLPATTFPDQVHDAASYVGQEQRVQAVPEDRNWDGSVEGLLQFPDVLRWLDENPGWTDDMGAAVTYQQADVLQAIQDYRRSVVEAGNLKTNRYQKVRYEPGRDIVIEPAQPDIVYVPSYDPVAATQPQPESPGINPWIAFGGGALVGALGAWALYSIFDDDDDREIRTYNNYYYGGRRRPRPVAWTPRPRPYRQQRPGAVRRPQRLRHVPTSPQPVRGAGGVRPPVRRLAQPGATLTPQQTRKGRRQEQQQLRQQHQQEQQLRRQEQRQQRQDRQMQQREQRQQRQQEQRQNKQERRQEHRQEQQLRQDRQQQRQQQQQMQRERQMDQRQQRQERQQRQVEQRQERRQEQREQRQERRQQQQPNEQENQQKKKKRQGQER